ncbi:MAG TPA: glycosyltransferase family 1 protein [Galbitalea sp.]|jgi:phosphatidylinositol alpha 1,6-mannosyltransferase|nr:glycosyltransferase family 1 protein [Galbitalea sp.]
MRVAVVTESFLPTVNGVTNSVCKVLDHLRLRGHEALVVVPSAGAPLRYAGFRVAQVPAVSYRRFPVGIPGPQVQKLLDDFAPDVVHVASPFLLGAEAIAASNRMGVPTVAIFQTDIAGYARRNHLGAATAVAWRIMRWVHSGADLTLAPSTSTMDDLARAHIDRVARWGRGVDLQRYHPRNAELKSTSELRGMLSPRGEVVVGYVGRLAPEKQVERMAALRGLPGIRFAVVGGGPSLPALRRRFAGMPVDFLGELHGGDLAAAYASFDVFLHTGTEETFGQTIQEAHASGLPVVAPRAGGPIDLVDHGTTGYLYHPGDDLELRATVELLARDPALRARLGAAGRRSVLSRSWTTICDQLMGHYDAVIEARRVNQTKVS